MDPDEISRHADKERRKKKKEEEEAAQDAIEVEPPAKPPVAADSFYVYSRIYPSKFRLMLWIFFAAGTGIAFLMTWALNEADIWSLYVGLAMIGIFLIRWTIEWIMKLATYNTYKNFRKHLPFTLEGWEKLGTQRDQLKLQHWGHDCAVEVTVKNGTSEADIKRINDALMLFTANANRQFYEGQFGSDGRKKWDFKHVLKVTGSADVGVIGEMYKLVQVYLKSIHQQYPVIEKVHVVLSDDISEVKPPVRVD